MGQSDTSSTKLLTVSIQPWTTKCLKIKTKQQTILSTKQTACLKKLNIDSMGQYDSTIPLLGTFPEEEKLCIHTKTCTQMFMATSFTVASAWKQPRCPAGEQTNAMWHIHTRKHYLTIKKSKILIMPQHGWTSKTITLSEASQTHKIPFLWNVQNKGKYINKVD